MFRLGWLGQILVSSRLLSLLFLDLFSSCSSSASYRIFVAYLGLLEALAYCYSSLMNTDLTAVKEDD